MPDKKMFIIFVLLCIISLGLGYWYGMPDKASEQRTEAGAPPAPTVVTNVMTNVVKETVPTVITNVVTIRNPGEKYVHSFVNCYSPDADKHIAHTINIRKVRDSFGGGRSFWIPAQKNKAATILYRYGFNRPIKSAKLYGRMYASGINSSGVFFASRDGRNWTLLKNFTDNAVPGKQEIDVGIPAAAMGGNTLFIKVELKATPSPILIQFSRNGSVGEAYRIELNFP